MHTIKVIASGVALLVLCVLIGRWFFGSARPSVGMAKGALVFIPLWLVAAAVNMWVGVSRAGYSVAEELPVFAIVFAIPSALALLVWWRTS